MCKDSRVRILGLPIAVSEAFLLLDWIQDVLGFIDLLDILTSIVSIFSMGKTVEEAQWRSHYLCSPSPSSSNHGCFSII